MKILLYLSLVFFISFTLTAQTEIDSIVIVENQTPNLDAFNCEQLQTYRYELNKKYYGEYFSAMSTAGKMSKKVSPCYYYRVEVKITRRFDDDERIELKNCNINVMGCSVFAQDYTFYIIKERSNPLFAHNPGSNIICDYDIKNLPDNR